MKNQLIQARLELLRCWMKTHNLSAFIIPTADEHNSEYTPLHWECRKWISGFMGSAGVAVVTQEAAALWTDSRYFLAAAEELSGTEFVLMKERVEGTPSVVEWLQESLHPNEIVGLDGRVNTFEFVSSLQTELQQRGFRLQQTDDPFEVLWDNRPPIPQDEICVQPLQYAGETAKAKIARVRQCLQQNACQGILISALDEIAWLFNLRGSDVHCTPVFVAWAWVTMQQATLFTFPQKITPKVRQYLQLEDITLEAYEEVENTLQNLSTGQVWLPESTNAHLRNLVSERVKIKSNPSPISSMKSVKNAQEVAGFRQAMLRDGVAMVQFLRWLEEAVPKGGETEMSVTQKLEDFRRAQSLYKENSFDTIAGYAEHGAIVHYEATPDTDKPLRTEGFLLLDSGAQYQDGTTDITRTISMGPPTAEEKKIYTLVLKGHIALSECKFPEGASGTQLDLAARYAMWQQGYNYGHGTGHGVGSFLSVHEGPHQIRMNYVPAPLKSGMIVTDEPGIYWANHFGVRIENMLLCVPYKETEFGKFVGFFPLTLCPIDVRPLDFNLLTPQELDWLNNYHQTVCNQILPLLENQADREWLLQATSPLSFPKV